MNRNHANPIAVNDAVIAPIIAKANPTSIKDSQYMYMRNGVITSMSGATKIDTRVNREAVPIVLKKLPVSV